MKLIFISTLFFFCRGDCLTKHALL